jgi:Flp pilus assembly pilin Flp
MLRCSQRFRALWLACKQLREDTRGVTALEYAILASVVVAAIVTVFLGVSNPLKVLFKNALDHLALMA